MRETIYTLRSVNIIDAAIGHNLPSFRVSAVRVREAGAQSQFGKLSVAMLLPLSLMLIMIFSSVRAMTELKEEEMAEVTGQALLQMGKEFHSGGVDSEGISYGDMTFYKAGLDVDLELNMNIKKLQLGCTAGAINGQHCDIDIDNLSLSGQTFPDGRPASSALLTRPFFEFAIKNDTSTTLREVVGIRMSAENATGMLTAGTENSATPNGINTLSGYLDLASTSGTGQTAQRNMTYPDTDMAITGRVEINYYLWSGTSPFSSTNYTVQVNPATANFTTNPTSVTGKRLTAATLSAVADVGDITIQCPPGTENECVEAVASNTALGTLTLYEGIAGTIRGVKADVNFSEDLGFIHKIPVDNPFSLSLQGENVRWPGATVAAQTGWWMAFEDQINIGDVSPTDPIQITNDVLKQLVGPISDYLYDHPAYCTALNCLTGTTLDVGVINLGPVSEGGNGFFGNPANYLDMPLSDLQLSAQGFTPNCWGSAKFC